MLETWAMLIIIVALIIVYFWLAFDAGVFEHIPGSHPGMSREVPTLDVPTPEPSSPGQGDGQ